ncbi:PREDICTED: uncharacterized protein LOC106805021 [Priapulus caudatus]|uniref:Uncharacterized protein LOC106805021 n=1 Tax=Priapulus caudatus TaxID=37621 RepID=A0ABM1DPV5_PRICU|nr:PREDICTED: uncharacterized protein LOC106805021 [Priapulus caudatus]
MVSTPSSSTKEMKTRSGRTVKVKTFDEDSTSTKPRENATKTPVAKPTKAISGGVARGNQKAGNDMMEVADPPQLESPVRKRGRPRKHPLQPAPSPLAQKTTVVSPPGRQVASRKGPRRSPRMASSWGEAETASQKRSANQKTMRKQPKTKIKRLDLEEKAAGKDAEEKSEKSDGTSSEDEEQTLLQYNEPEPADKDSESDNDNQSSLKTETEATDKKQQVDESLPESASPRPKKVVIPRGLPAGTTLLVPQGDTDSPTILIPAGMEPGSTLIMPGHDTRGRHGDEKGNVLPSGAVDVDAANEGNETTGISMETVSASLSSAGNASILLPQLNQLKPSGGYFVLNKDGKVTYRKPPQEGKSERPLLPKEGFLIPQPWGNVMSGPDEIEKEKEKERRRRDEKRRTLAETGGVRPESKYLRKKRIMEEEMVARGQQIVRKKRGRPRKYFPAAADTNADEPEPAPAAAAPPASAPLSPPGSDVAAAGPATASGVRNARGGAGTAGAKTAVTREPTSDPEVARPITAAADAVTKSGEESGRAVGQTRSRRYVTSPTGHLTSCVCERCPPAGDDLTTKVAPAWKVATGGKPDSDPPPPPPPPPPPAAGQEGATASPPAYGNNAFCLVPAAGSHATGVGITPIYVAPDSGLKPPLSLPTMMMIVPSKEGEGKQLCYMVAGVKKPQPGKQTEATKTAAAANQDHEQKTQVSAGIQKQNASSSKVQSERELTTPSSGETQQEGSEISEETGVKQLPRTHPTYKETKDAEAKTADAFASGKEQVRKEIKQQSIMTADGKCLVAVSSDNAPSGLPVFKYVAQQVNAPQSHIAQQRRALPAPSALTPRKPAERRPDFKQLLEAALDEASKQNKIQARATRRAAAPSTDAVPVAATAAAQQEPAEKLAATRGDSNEPVVMVIERGDGGGDPGDVTDSDGISLLSRVAASAAKDPASRDNLYILMPSPEGASAAQEAAWMKILESGGSQKARSSRNWTALQQDPMMIPEYFEEVIDYLDDHYPSLSYKTGETSGNEFYLEITRHLTDVPLDKGGPLHAARVVAFADGTARFQVLCQTGKSTKILAPSMVEGKTVALDHEKFEEILQYLDDRYVMCFGIEVERFDEMFPDADHNVKSKNYMVESFPFVRVMSMKCEIWYKMPKNATSLDRATLSLNMCKNCTQLYYSPNAKQKRGAGLAEPRRARARTSRPRDDVSLTRDELAVRFRCDALLRQLRAEQLKFATISKLLNSGGPEGSTVVFINDDGDVAETIVLNEGATEENFDGDGGALADSGALADGDALVNGGALSDGGALVDSGAISGTHEFLEDEQKNEEEGAIEEPCYNAYDNEAVVGGAGVKENAQEHVEGNNRYLGVVVSDTGVVPSVGHVATHGEDVDVLGQLCEEVIGNDEQAMDVQQEVEFQSAA